jgi:Rv0078B-related antitoxin
MNAEAASEAQIAKYRQMTGEQRLTIALNLHELSCEMARAGIRRQHPTINAGEVEKLLHRRLELARRQ